MKCDQCVAAMINGYFCHETGCPNTNKIYDTEEQRWLTPEIDEDELDEPLEDEDIYYYVSVRYNHANGEVTECEVVDHGRENAQYFQGCGVMFTRYSDVTTGIGEDASEALEDALDSIAQNQITFSEFQEQQMHKELD